MENEFTEKPEEAPAEAGVSNAPQGETVEADGTEEAEKEIDLNRVFPDVEGDLNELFPDLEMKTFLKKIKRNQKDLDRMKENFSEPLASDPSDA